MKSAKEILTSHNKFHITLGLERIKKILDLLDNPQEKYQTIHIAGTNGKGSTSKIINDILIKNFKDKKIGLYTSPHLFNYEERIKINNININSYIFNRLINDIDNLALENTIELSEFELLCACAFYYFYLKKTDYVILETGLGGLYDATNIIKNPLAEVITSISLEHTERLGSTIDEIAAQKAGIIKENSKVIISKDNEGYSTVEKIASEKNAEIITAADSEIEYEFNLRGKHQRKNLALALTCVNSLFKINEQMLIDALKNVRWDFRLEYLKDKNILIDAAHNPSGAKVLRDFLDENFKNTKKTFIFGCLKNKDYKTMLKTLKKDEDEFYFYEFNYPNSLKFEEIKEIINVQKITDIEEIKNIIENNKNLKIFCGSIYMLGDLFKDIKIV